MAPWQIKREAASGRSSALSKAFSGQVEVLDGTTLLLRLEPEDQQPGEAEEDSLILGHGRRG